MDNDEYTHRVNMLARNALEQGESPRTVAETAVVATENVGDEKAVRYSAEPFVDDPSTQTRLWPKDVLTGASRRLIAEQPDALRPLAVEVLKADLYDRMMEIENDTARPWGEA